MFTLMASTCISVPASSAGLALPDGAGWMCGASLPMRCRRRGMRMVRRLSGLRGGPADGVGGHWWERLSVDAYKAHQLPDPVGKLGMPYGW